MRSACCALPSDRQAKIQPAIATFSAGEFRRQPALSDNTGHQVLILLHCSLVIALDSGSRGLASSPGRGPYCCVLGQDTLFSQCLSSPWSMNGYWQQTIRET